MIYTARKTKDWATRTLLKTGRELMYFGRLSSTCTSSGTRRVTFATNHVMSIERTRFCDYDKLNMPVIMYDTSIPYD
jgi:hypothetical protein